MFHNAPGWGLPVALSILALVVLACTAPFIVGTSVPASPRAGSGSSLQTSVSTPVANAGNAPPPQVRIESPPSGIQIVVKQSLTVRVHATDSVGITRVEMREAGRIVVSQPSPDPNPDFIALLEYRPVNVGTVTLEVVAFRQSVASDPVAIIVEVVATVAEVRNAAAQSPIAQVAPNAFCTARANVNGLALRAGPGTTYRILDSVKLGEQLNVVGRNASQTWYQVTRNPDVGVNVTAGWVGAGYTSSEGDCSRAPVTTPTP